MKQNSQDQKHEDSPHRKHHWADAQKSAIARASEIAQSLGGRVVTSSSGESIHVITENENLPSARETVRAKLMKAGVLATDLGIPHDTIPVSDEELERTGDMRPGARPSEALVDEDRGM